MDHGFTVRVPDANGKTVGQELAFRLTVGMAHSLGLAGKTLNLGALLTWGDRVADAIDEHVAKCADDVRDVAEKALDEGKAELHVVMDFQAVVAAVLEALGEDGDTNMGDLTAFSRRVWKELGVDDDPTDDGNIP